MIERFPSMDNDITIFHHDGLREYTLNLKSAEPVAAEFPPEHGLADASGLILFQFEGGEPLWADAPVMWLHGGGLPHQFAGVQALALAGAPVHPIQCEGQCVGYAYSDAHADYCWVIGLLPGVRDVPQADQAADCLERLAACLALAGMEPTHIVRTWFYLDGLFEWYEEFNQVRDRFFHKHGILDRFPPASTGIGAANHAGAAVMAGALAVRPRSEACRVQPVVSPLQCPAMDYRRSFSRAVELVTPNWSKLYISGTASIGDDGQTLHSGEVDLQIERTLDVCQALLDSRRMNWRHVTRAIAYFSDERDQSRLEPILRRRFMPDLPLMIVQGRVCREDLLFELELDAVAMGPAKVTAS